MADLIQVPVWQSREWFNLFCDLWMSRETGGRGNYCERE